MAIYDCPECGHKVSTSAERCPKCGADIEYESPYVWKDDKGKIIGSIYTSPSTCHHCGGKLPASTDPKERVFEYEPGANRSEGAICYTWHPQCYEQAKKKYEKLSLSDLVITGVFLAVIFGLFALFFRACSP